MLEQCAPLSIETTASFSSWQWHIFIILVFNHRYAFTPLLDDGEDCSSDEEDLLYSDAWDGMKKRGGNHSRPETPDGADPEEDPLKWVEENIPDIEGAMPVIDSEEEIETTKVEISKLMWGLLGTHQHCFPRSLYITKSVIAVVI